MDYAQTLNYLYNKLPMFSRIGAAAFKKDLTNTRKLCASLGNPQDRLKTVHIAGTNGKGSTSHMLAAVLQSAGYKVGLYTSPHLKDFRERIKVNGELCEEQFVIDFVRKIQPLIEEIEPSFFEITVAMAFEYFVHKQTDICIIETGLGGRFDSTNILHPELSVITNIGWDHMDMLGNSLTQIAGEKAGIIKDGIPIIVGEVISETKPVFEAAATLHHAPLIFAQEKRYVTDWSYDRHQLSVNIAETGSDIRSSYILDLPGIYQTKNLITVLEAIHQLQSKGWKIDKENIENGLHHAKKITGLHGRWEKIHAHPDIIIDVGHNEDGIRQIVEQLELSTYRELHIILGFVKDKAVEKLLPILPRTAHYYFTKAQTPRALPENELARFAATAGLSGKTFPEVNIAIADALQHTHPDDLILVCGSVFLVGEVSVGK